MTSCRQPGESGAGRRAWQPVFLDGLRTTGNVSAAARVTLGATAHIDGDIKTPSLSIAEGAQIMGRIEVKPGAGENNRPKSAPSATPSPDPAVGQRPVAAPVGEGQG